MGVAKGGRVFLDKIFPDHWSFMLGEIALYSFIVLLATGIFLSLYFVPSTQQVIYHGSYGPLNGQWVSEAYRSTVSISFDVRGGLLVRQMHHWAADIFTGSIIVHMARIFFTGAFRKPRELNWLIGTTMLILAILEGFIGYSLPDDLISGTGLRIGYSIAAVHPLRRQLPGTFLCGGQVPGDGIIIPRFFIIHVLIIPLVLAGPALRPPGVAGPPEAHPVRRQGPHRAQRGRLAHVPDLHGQDDRLPLHGDGGTALLGGLAQINPIWQFGPYDPSKISYAVQPDWYMGWLDGALRIMPVLGVAGWGHTIPWEVFLPAVVFPGLIFTICHGAGLSSSARYTKDNEMHNLLDRPRDRPKRTAAGAAMFALLFTLFAASSTDVLANFFHVSLNSVLWFFRIAVFVVPVVAGLRHLPDVPGDAGRARDRQAQAGRDRAAHARGRVHHGADSRRDPTTCTASSTPARPGSHRHRATRQRWHP